MFAYNTKATLLFIAALSVATTSSHTHAFTVSQPAFTRSTPLFASEAEEDAKGIIGTVKDKASSAKDKVKDVAGDVKDYVKDKAGTVKVRRILVNFCVSIWAPMNTNFSCLKFSKTRIKSLMRKITSKTRR